MYQALRCNVPYMHSLHALLHRTHNKVACTGSITLTRSMPRPHTGILHAGPAMCQEKLHLEFTIFKLEKDGIK
jgi:hypothetical protein